MRLFRSLEIPTLLLQRRLRTQCDSHISRSPASLGVWQGMAIDSLKFQLGPPWPTLLCPAGGPPLKQPFSCFRGGSPTGWAACSPLQPFGTPHGVHQCLPASMPDALSELRSCTIHCDSTFVISKIKSNQWHSPICVNGK
jgi:hypothetical protein